MSINHARLLQRLLNQRDPTNREGSFWKGLSEVERELVVVVLGREKATVDQAAMQRLMATLTAARRDPVVKASPSTVQFIGRLVQLIASTVKSDLNPDGVLKPIVTQARAQQTRNAALAKAQKAKNPRRDQLRKLWTDGDRPSMKRKQFCTAHANVMKSCGDAPAVSTLMTWLRDLPDRDKK